MSEYRLTDTNADRGNVEREMQAPSPTSADTLLHAHLAEYQALTTRCTYLITMQYAFWPVAFTMFAFLSPLWDKHGHLLLEWGGILLGELLSIAFYVTSCELYTHTLYIERQLKPAVVKLTAEPALWQWEPWLASRSGRRPELWESWITVCIALVLCFMGYTRYPWTAIDWMGFVVSGAAFAFILRLNLMLVNLRHEFSKT
jgi:hypothetical protein